jgi:hypothetical protein
MNMQTNVATRTLTISTQSEAREFAEGLIEVMTGLLRLVEAETTLVRAGRVRDALELGAHKEELSRRYVTAISLMKANQSYLKQSAPELMDMLRRHHDAFRTMLDLNLTVLATAHAVSEGIVRGVNSDMQRRTAPQTYTAAGMRAAPPSRHAAPLAVSRSL